MTESKATATINSTRTSDVQLLDDESLDGVVAGLDCSTAVKVADAYRAAGAAMRAVGQSWVAHGLESTASGVTSGACGMRPW